MTSWRWTFAGLLVLVASPGCGSSDDGKNANQQCEELISLFCSSAIGCEVSGGLLEASKQTAANESCVAGAHQEVNCSKALAVSANYQACMKELANPPCDAINQAIQQGTSLGLPKDCEGVILTRQ